MRERGIAAFTLATTAVALMVLAILQSLAFFGVQYWPLLIGPAVGLLLSGGVWLALKQVCTGGGRRAHVTAFGGILLLCVWAFLSLSFGGAAVIPAALALMVAHAIVPSPR